LCDEASHGLAELNPRGTQPRVSSTFGNPKRPRYFGHGCVVEVVKNEHGALVVVERLEGSRDDAATLLDGQPLLGGRLRIRRVGVRHDLSLVTGPPALFGCHSRRERKEPGT
jgi:hypothetical protein